MKMWGLKFEARDVHWIVDTGTPNLFKAEALVACLSDNCGIKEFSKFTRFDHFDYLYIKFAEKQPFELEYKDLIRTYKKDIDTLSKGKSNSTFNFGSFSLNNKFEEFLAIDMSRALHHVSVNNKYPIPHLTHFNATNIKMSLWSQVTIDSSLEKQNSLAKLKSKSEPIVF